MNTIDLEHWLTSLKKSISDFLSQLLDKNNFYHYSLSGDIYPPQIKWGLGNAVFASKIYYMLEELTSKKKKNLADFIKSFQNSKGYIHDPLVQRISKLRRYYNAFRTCDFENIFNEQTRRAETRQAFAALCCLKSKPNQPFLHIPYTESDIENYVHRLNWNLAWGAGSHISHLLFFLKKNSELYHINDDKSEKLIQYVIDLVNDKYRRDDGSWYLSSAKMPHFQKVNAAMKMMIGFDAAGKLDFDNEIKLIDLCLAAINEGHACNHFNVICVLYHCSRKTDYKRKEIRQYCLNQLSHYRQYYWPDSGGFSFFKGKANHNYYGAIISRGLKEPDIHGTVLFLWGISLIVKMLEYDHLIQLNAPIT